MPYLRKRGRWDSNPRSLDRQSRVLNRTKRRPQNRKTAKIKILKTLKQFLRFIYLFCVFAITETLNRKKTFKQLVCKNAKNQNLLTTLLIPNFVSPKFKIRPSLLSNDFK